jgi:hypothetical protein
MTNIIVDCESSGPCPIFGDLIEFAAITESGMEFKSRKMPPLFPNYDAGAYQALGITREEHEAYTGDVKVELSRFYLWIEDVTTPGKRPIFWSDNLAYDWQWINWGFPYAGLGNPFGHSGRNISDLFAGANGKFNDRSSWKRFRKTKHTHDPLDDVRGNLEAFLEIRKRFKL